MKRLIVLTAIIISSVTFGQEKHSEKREQHKKGRMEMMKDLSPEQMATLRTKKMTLALDLSNSQQDKIYAINLDTAKKRKHKMEAQKNTKGEKPKLSSDEKYNLINTRLDEKIVLKNKVKSILNEEQFLKWERAQKHSKKRKKKNLMRN